MRQGKIVKIISNQYQVYADGSLYDCIAMGKLRKGKSPVVGDYIEFEQLDDKYGIQKINPRVNELTRPAIANVDQAIIVMSAVDPEFSTVLIDRLIFLICYANITPVLCVTKMDLVEHKEDTIYKHIEEYKQSGYAVFLTGNDYDTTVIEEMLKDKVSVLTGQSGAGKSSLLNRINVEFNIRTQKTSKALGRGKHTTRHSELFHVAGGWVADTPGFSSLNFDALNAFTLGQKIPDFIPYLQDCKFNDCMHINEPNCGVINALAKEKIVGYRHEHYKDIVKQIEQVKQKY